MSRGRLQKAFSTFLCSINSLCNKFIFNSVTDNTFYNVFYIKYVIWISLLQLTMLPTDILELIYQMLDSMNEYSDLPSKRAVTRLVKKTDDFVLSVLGDVLGMNTPAVEMMRFRIRMDSDFIFYFRFSILQRTRMIALLREAISQNVHVSSMIWIFIVRKPPLTNYPEYKRIFTNGLFCRLVCFLVPHSL